MRGPATKQAKRSIKRFHLGIAKAAIVRLIDWSRASSGGSEVAKYLGGSFARDRRVSRFLGGAR